MRSFTCRGMIKATCRSLKLALSAGAAPKRRNSGAATTDALRKRSKIVYSSDSGAKICVELDSTGTNVNGHAEYCQVQLTCPATTLVLYSVHLYG